MRSDSMPMSRNDTVSIRMEKARLRKHAPLLASLLVLAATLLAYVTKPDGLACLTIWPFWVWMTLWFWITFGALSLALKDKRARARTRLAVFLLWTLAWAVTSEEPWSLARAVTSPSSHSLRVVSLNCAGTEEAVLEVIQLKPDIVLIQESVGRDGLETLRSKLGEDWTMVVGIDASILARGDLKPAGDPPYPANHTAAWHDGTLVVSLRLAPPVFRLDYWNPVCWTAYAEKKRNRRRELDALVAMIQKEAGGAPIIIGGDFNTPPDGSITASLSHIAEDAFVHAGRGWGATAINDFPMVRIDQIWASDDFQPVNAFGVTTKSSDHRIAVADYKSK